MHSPHCEMPSAPRWTTVQPQLGHTRQCCVRAIRSDASKERPGRSSTRAERRALAAAATPVAAAHGAQEELDARQLVLEAKWLLLEAEKAPPAGAESSVALPLSQREAKSLRARVEPLVLPNREDAQAPRGTCRTESSVWRSDRATFREDVASDAMPHGLLPT